VRSRPVAACRRPLESAGGSRGGGFRTNDSMGLIGEMGWLVVRDGLRDEQQASCKAVRRCAAERCIACGTARGRVRSKEDFSGRDLRRSNFTNASIKNANFTNAKLQGAYFIKATAAGTNFTVRWHSPYEPPSFMRKRTLLSILSQKGRPSHSEACKASPSSSSAPLTRMAVCGIGRRPVGRVVRSCGGGGGQLH
jgi:hypothetical protein